jgi:hypothetical protein
MTQTTRDQVTFEVPTAVEGIPAGQHRGYVEHMTIAMRGESVTQLARCMLHIERSEHPECFSPKNSFIAIDIDVIKHVLNGSISYR